MTDTHENNDSQQAKKKLFVAVAFLAVAAVVLLVLQILPGQFGIDLTGYGTYTGLMQVYESEQHLKKLRNTTEQQEQVEIEIAAGEELEYKLYLLEGDSLEYSWKTDQGEIYSEFHGEPRGGHSALFETYTKSTGSDEQEKWTAPFEGTHGWYWHNDNEFAVKVTLDTQGKYNTVGRKRAAFSRK